LQFDFEVDLGFNLNELAQIINLNLFIGMARIFRAYKDFFTQTSLISTLYSKEDNKPKQSCHALNWHYTSLIELEWHIVTLLASSWL